VPVYSSDPAYVRRAVKRKETPAYMGTFSSARRFVLHTFATTESATIKKRVAQYLVATDCPECRGKRLQRASLAVTFAGRDIGELARLPLARLAEVMRPYAAADASIAPELTATAAHPERALVAQRIAEDLLARVEVLLRLGLGYLALDRSTPTLSPGELARLRLATQVRSNLFGVVYVLDEPSAGLHPADTRALLATLDQLKAAGNSLFVVEHELDVVRHADWIVDVGPAAGAQGGEILYSGPPAGLARVAASQTRRHLFGEDGFVPRAPRPPRGWLRLEGVTRHNLRGLDVAFPLAAFTTVTGVSGSGKSSLVSQALVELVAAHLGHEAPGDEDETIDPLERRGAAADGGAAGRIVAGAADPPPGACRPEADRAHAALEPRHLHRALRSRAQALRRHQGGARAALRRRPILLQRRQGPLQDLRGRGLRLHRDALPALGLRAVPDLPRLAL